MDPAYWHQRWADGLTGWHREAFNPHLEAHWPRLNVPPGARVFVPLSGKTRDLLWLAGEGHRVVGVELSELAAQAFFAEAGLAPKISQAGGFRRYAVDEIEILCGDFFDLTTERLGPFEAVYDRASLIALPPAMRPRYAAQMTRLTPAGALVLLVTLEYPQGEMSGPPFSVEEAEVRALYAPAFEIAPLAAADVLDENAHLRERGVTRLVEPVYALRRLAPAA